MPVIHSGRSSPVRGASPERRASALTPAPTAAPDASPPRSLVGRTPPLRLSSDSVGYDDVLFSPNRYESLPVEEPATGERDIALDASVSYPPPASAISISSVATESSPPVTISDKPEGKKGGKTKGRRADKADGPSDGGKPKSKKAGKPSEFASAANFPSLDTLLPAHEDMTGGQYLTEIYNLLAEIPELLCEHRSVKKEARQAAIDNSKKVAYLIAEFARLRTSVDTSPAEPSSAAPAPATIPAEAPVRHLGEGLSEIIERTVTRVIRTELGRAASSRGTPQGPAVATYAQVAAAAPVPAAAPPQPRLGNAVTQAVATSRPSIILSCRREGPPREAAVKALKEVIKFKEVGYTPARISQLSNRKVKVEFDDSRHAEDAIERINSAPSSMGISAEKEKKLRPLVIMKGLSKTIRREDVVDMILEQNEEFAEMSRQDISVRFIRNNRSPYLYNAVLSASPLAWRTFMRLGRVRMDYQRIHCEEFSPFVQCRRCLEFGHTQGRCAAEPRCVHCGRTGHQQDSCPISTAPPICANCTSHNAKFKTSWDTKHLPTTQDCPRFRSIFRRVMGKVDYGLQ